MEMQSPRGKSDVLKSGRVIIIGTSPGIGKRHGQSIMFFIGKLALNTLKVNLSVGVVAMTSKSNSNSPVLDWDTSRIGVLSSMIYYGMMVAQLASGFLLGKFGPSILVSTALVLSGLASILMPYIAVNVGFEAACVLRIIDGLGQGLYFPTIVAHTAKWAVRTERGLMYTVATSGGSMGSILMLSTGGFIAASSLGWPGIFYLSGGLGLAWGILGFIILRDSPSAHKSISKLERDWIHSGLRDTSTDCRLPIPWREILTSGRVWVGIAAIICSEWGHSLTSTLTPTYLSGVLGISISKNGIFSCLPSIINFVLTAFCGIASDFTLRKKYLPLWTIRRLWSGLGFFGGAAGLIILGTTSFGVAGTVSILSLASGIDGLFFSGHVIMAIDLAPNFSGAITGLQHGFSDIGAICAPTIAGIIVTDKYNTSQWELMFLITAGIYIFGGALYIVFGSAKVQPWNKPKTDLKI